MKEKIRWHQDKPKSNNIEHLILISSVFSLLLNASKVQDLGFTSGFVYSSGAYNAIQVEKLMTFYLGTLKLT